MCAVSYVGDYWSNTFPGRYPGINPSITIPMPGQVGAGVYSIQHYVTQAQFDQLKNEVAELKQLLLAAKKFDEATGQPDCEVEDKVALIKAVAKMVGVDMKDVFPD